MGFSEIDFLPLSPHKLLGGYESTGVLIVKNKSYVCKDSPRFPGVGSI